MNQAMFEIQAQFCKAMGNATRLQILHSLRKGPMNVGDIARKTSLSHPLVSRQLGVLRQIGVLTCHRNGSEMIYQLTDSRLSEVCDLIRQILVEQIRVQSRIF